MAEKTDGLLSEVFTGSGNNEEDAKSIAEIRYETWRKGGRKKGVKYKEIDKEYIFEERNSVYCKCKITVSYTLTEQ